MAARADEVAMVAIHADPQILEEHLAVEATVACVAPAFPSQNLVNCAI